MKRKPSSAKQPSAKGKGKPVSKPARPPVSKPKRQPPASKAAEEEPTKPGRSLTAAKSAKPKPTKPPAKKTAPKQQAKQAKVKAKSSRRDRGRAKPKASTGSARAQSGPRRKLPSKSGPGQRYALGPESVSLQPELLEEVGELPEAYGSKRLFLTARDPHWLYAHWDYTSEQLRECTDLAAGGRLVLRIHVESLSTPPCNEVAVHPASRNWFLHVGQGGTKYLAELGYYAKTDRTWVSLSQSSATLTPPDVLAGLREVDFATIPPEVPFQTLIALIQSAAKENIPLAEAIQQLRSSGYPGLPEPTEWPKTDWSPEQERQLSEAVAASTSMDDVRRVWVGSMEITEMLRRRLQEQRGSAELVSSAGVAQFGQPQPVSSASLASPYGRPEQPKSFWFNVNAELIIYGATEPDANVTLGGKEIRLRPDGSFSFRFALPDGHYELPAVAVSSDGSDKRVAALEFARSTDYSGEVGTHPQDPSLKKPEASSVE